MREIERLVPIDHRRVLELGAGNGRLTFAYAERAAQVLALDQDPAAVREGRAKARQAGLSHVLFRRRSAELVRPDDGPVDVAIFSWSLC